jgi:hypothetical protein
MKEKCLSDCWVCEKTKTCTAVPNCSVVFDGAVCQMVNVCNRKKDMCPCCAEAGTENELGFENA